MINIIAIGKKHEPWVGVGIDRYSKRLRAPYDLAWSLLPHSALAEAAARNEESERIQQRLRPADYVILLDERGKMIDSPTLSANLQRLFVESKNVVLVIGGAYGVSDELLQRANFVWSLSPLVFPHQLVRLIVAEQLYRAGEIATGHPYHHE